MQTQYAVCHLQRGSGGDSGMTCHIERKTANGKTYVPDNADKNRTPLNREIIRFPTGVTDRSAAIQYRLDHAGLHRKVGKNQVKALRIILTGTHEQMMKLWEEGRLDAWIDANISWLHDTFGEDNLVSCVLHMDEKTPHLHATITPIVYGERQRREREGAKKYKTGSGPRLSADEVMSRWRLRGYQDSYGKAMKPFGLERGIVGSTARHVTNDSYYKSQLVKYEEDIQKLQEEVERAKEGRSRLFAFFGKGDLAKAKKELVSKDEEIERLEKAMKKLAEEKEALKQHHREELSRLKNGYLAEIEKAIKENSSLKRNLRNKESRIEEQNRKIESLDRKVNPQRYRLSSGAELVHYNISNPLHPSLHIWTRVGDEEYDSYVPMISSSPVWEKFSKGDATIWELANDVFEPYEQVNEKQAELLGAAMTLLSGGPAQVHIGTGGGGDSPKSPWGEKEKNKRKR